MAAAMGEPTTGEELAGEGTRTPNRLITNEMLYQLSYASRARATPRKSDRTIRPGADQCQEFGPGTRFEVGPRDARPGSRIAMPFAHGLAANFLTYMSTDFISTSDRIPFHGGIAFFPLWMLSSS
jgi:hypothetical protein